MGVSYLLTLILFVGSHAMTTAGAFGINVSWDIDGSNIVFTTKVDADTVTAANWWGWGVNGSANMVGADIYLFYKHLPASTGVVDSHADANQRPETDADGHITTTRHEGLGDGTFISVFSRPLSTGNEV